MEAGATHTTVRNDVGLGIPDDPPEAGFLAGTERSLDVPNRAEPVGPAR